MKRSQLRLNRETLRVLSPAQIKAAAGAGAIYTPLCTTPQLSLNTCESCACPVSQYCITRICA